MAVSDERDIRDSEARYRTLFDCIDEGFCVIEFLVGPLSDYIHVEANAAYASNAGIPNVVGQRVREMVPDEADGWVKRYVEVLKTGQPIRFEPELVATGRHLELAAFRVEPASRREVAVLFKDVTARKRAERALQELNETHHRCAGRSELHQHRGGRRPGRPGHLAIQPTYRFADHRCRPARWVEWQTRGGRGADAAVGSEGAVHYRLSRECGLQSWPYRPGDGAADQAVRDRRPGAAGGADAPEK